MSLLSLDNALTIARYLIIDDSAKNMGYDKPKRIAQPFMALIVNENGTMKMYKKLRCTFEGFWK